MYVTGKLIICDKEKIPEAWTAHVQDTGNRELSRVFSVYIMLNSTVNLFKAISGKRRRFVLKLEVDDLGDACSSLSKKVVVIYGVWEKSASVNGEFRYLTYLY